MCRVKTTTIQDKTFKVAEIKEKYIRNVIDASGQCDLIDKIVLFGSCTGNKLEMSRILILLFLEVRRNTERYVRKSMTDLPHRYIHLMIPDSLMQALY